jgi:hypothetical protein
MKTKAILMACVAGLLTACSQKQSVVSVPVSQIDVEQLNKTIDYNMDISGLSLSDLRVLRNAPAARKGFPFKDAYIRGVYQGTSWYDSLMWKYDEMVNFENLEQKEDESWRDFYYRAGVENGILKFTDEEVAFMKRVQEREDELMKHNFDVDEDLRVNVQNIVNPTQLKTFDSTLCLRLAQNGFAIVPAQHEQLFHVYEQNDYSCFPSFVTTDLYLQLFHLYFDCMLREIEENKLHAMMTKLSLSMYLKLFQQANSTDNEEIKSLATYDAAFFAIAYELFTGASIGTSDFQAITKPEVKRVMDSKNDFSDFIEDYQNVMFSYSLFRPRGHYSRNENLKKYFRGMMWLQSVPFGLDEEISLRRAIVMADALNNEKNAQKDYDQLNVLLNYLMGSADNLSIPQVQAEIKKIGKPLGELLSDANAIATIKKNLDEIGEKQTRIRPKFEMTSHNKVCLMPQRYQPDAEVLQEMVDYDNDPTKRATPKGLDFFAAMGVSPAEQILIEEGQQWKDFKPMLTKMKTRMQEINWDETIATQWMNALKVVSDKADNQPYFMGTPEWDKKNLNAMLASWAELKHDAILYAKQPFGAECGGGGLPDPVVMGYVEPNVGFWKKAIELLDNTSKLLKEQGMLTEKVDDATTRIREEAEFLLRTSEKELRGETLAEEEYDQIKCMGATFENISLDLLRQPNQSLMGWDDVQGADKKVALIADVYTANAKNNPDKSVLFEGVGLADEIYVIVEIEGCLYIARGAVLSYREFTQPMDLQRLTDEEWQKQLEQEPRKGVPDWMKSILVPMPEGQKPELNEEFFYSSGC